jgi:hypothetical protein
MGTRSMHKQSLSNCALVDHYLSSGHTELISVKEFTTARVEGSLHLVLRKLLLLSRQSPFA